jgi:phosphoribosylaminoimidazole-succinocarboxamide synthase
LAGHAWREYNSGKRELCGVSLPEGLKENDPLPEPIITPSIKENSGHDRDISMSEILASKLLKKKDLDLIEAYTKTLYEAGKKIAADRDLILVDTKYEFGFAQDGKILLMDEVHTPDSSRYFYIDEYNENLSNHHNQRQLSKEFVRQWLMEQGFQGLKDQKVPEMSDEFIESVTNRYIELYEKVTSDTFVPRSYDNVMLDIENNVNNYIINNPLN